MTPYEEDADFTYFDPARAHLLLKGVYRDYPYHNDGSHLDGGVPDDAMWQCHCHCMDAQLDNWYASPQVWWGAGSCQYWPQNSGVLFTGA